MPLGQNHNRNTDLCLRNLPSQTAECRVYERLKGKFEFENRGVIQVKGKGEIETFLLHSQVVAEGVSR